jgi:phytoene synthase
MTVRPAADRAALVAAARDTIAIGSQSFKSASMLFAPATRERAWLLYSWCRALDDLTDGQELGHAAIGPTDPAAIQTRLVSLTAAALDSDTPVPPAFAALRQVARETAMPRRMVEDHLAGFALDAGAWRPQSEDDLLRYCYHVAGSVGCMMAVIMGVDPADEDTLDRACDLGLAFQLANIARDIVPDAKVGRCYIPTDWLADYGLSEAAIADPSNRQALAKFARRLVILAEPYRASARIGAARLPARSRLAVLAADAIYGAIGERVMALGPGGWDRRVSIAKAGKVALFAQALVRGLRRPAAAARYGLWTRPRQSSESVGSRS